MPRVQKNIASLPSEGTTLLSFDLLILHREVTLSQVSKTIDSFTTMGTFLSSSLHCHCQRIKLRALRLPFLCTSSLPCPKGERGHVEYYIIEKYIYTNPSPLPQVHRARSCMTAT